MQETTRQDGAAGRPRRHRTSPRRLRTALAGLGATAALAAMSATAGAAPGDLDPGFGSAGIVTRDVLPGTITSGVEPTEVIRLADDRVVVAGRNDGDDVFVARLLADGSLDPAFGGIRSFDMDAGSFDEVGGMAVDSLGRIVVGGRAGSKAFLIRLTGTGALDTSFDGDGKRIDEDVSGFVNWSDLVVDTDDGIYTTQTGHYPSKVYRFLPSGAPDTAFGAGGVATTALDLNDAKIALDGNRRVVVGGSNSGSGYSAYRLQGMGDGFPGFFDNGFDTDGQVTLASVSGNFRDIEIDTLNRPVLLGGGLADGYELIRLTTGGGMDNGFDTDGKLTDPIPGGASDEAFDLEVSGTTSFVAGSLSSAGNGGFIRSLLADGGPNLGFGDGGLSLLTVPCESPGPGVACGIRSISADALVYAAKRTSSDPSSAQVGRIQGNGSYLTTFGGDGVVQVQPSRPWDSTVVDAVRVPDGATYVLGFSGPYNDESTWIVRQLPDGSLDPGFGSGGRIVVDLMPGSPDYVEGIAVAPSGLIYVAGVDLTANPNRALVWRFTSAGLDGAFGTAGRVTQGFGSATHMYAGAIAIDGLGRVVLGGGDISTGGPPEVRRVWLARMDGAGAPDPAFNGGQARFFDLPGSSNEFIDSLQLLPDGSIVGTGGADNVMAAVKVDAAGQPVAGFGTAGARTYPELGTLDAGRYGIGALAGATAFVGGTFSDGGDRMIKVIRLGADGAPDAGFGTGGSVVIGAGNAKEDVLQDLQTDAAGRLLAVGFGGSFTAPDSLVARILPTGALDPAFAGGGVAVRDLSGGGTTDRLVAVFERTGGAIVGIGGVIDPSTRESRLLTVRLQGDPPPPAPPVSPAPAGTSKIVAPRHNARIARTRFRVISGRATASGSPIRRVQVSVRRVDPRRCRFLRSVRGTFTATRPVARKCPRPVWITVSGRSAWRLVLRSRLPAGRYEIRSRVVLANGTTESRFVLRRNLVTVTLR